MILQAIFFIMKNKKRKKQKTLRDLLEQLEIRKELVEEIRKTRDSFSVEEKQRGKIFLQKIWRECFKDRSGIFLFMWQQMPHL